MPGNKEENDGGLGLKFNIEVNLRIYQIWKGIVVNITL